MKSETNPKGAGRKQAPYKTTTIRVPVDLKEQVYELIKQYKHDALFSKSNNKDTN